MSDVKHAPTRAGHWLPEGKDFLDAWLGDLILRSQSLGLPLLPVVAEFKELIENDAELYMAFTTMFTQVPSPYSANLPMPQGGRKVNPLGEFQVTDYQQMLELINTVLYEAPTYSKIADQVGLIGFPINTILDWTMGTPGGFWAFSNDKVNAQLKKILNYWSTVLVSPESCYVLTDTVLERKYRQNHDRLGWFTHTALEALAAADPLRGKNGAPYEAYNNFVHNFECDPDKPHWGYKSWDDFFTRLFRDGVRPVASPDDDAVIANACESAPYRVCYGVKQRDTFWIKGQPYSLQHVLNNDDLADQFYGGTVYQAFLSAKSYHRWHSPVSGTIRKVVQVEGTYYSETLAEGFDPAGPNDSQGYIAQVAARALVFIDADNKDIGLMCVVPIGMAEVSSCDVTVKPGDKVKKGEQLGMFHFGGSTHLLIFGPQVQLAFDLHGLTPGLDAEANIPLSSRIATVVKS